MFPTPILFLIFNRPNNTKKVFAEIRKQKPKYLYIAADGPRNDLFEITLCKEVRKVVTNIDWDCELKTLFREKNLGCKYAVSSAIDWFFEHVEGGIILEDDCLPDTSFFLFCDELLKKYKHDNKIMHITGTNLNDNLKFGDGSYYCSNYPNIWGWATWKRAWEKYDLELNNTDFYLELIKNKFKYHSEQKFWESRINLLDTGLDTWDYQWMFSIWREDGICLNSNYNLVLNIGFDKEATHTNGENPYLTPEIKQITNIQHPSKCEINENAEIQLITLLHGLKRKGYLEYFLHNHCFQRYQNLIHKLKGKVNGVDI